MAARHIGGAVNYVGVAETLGISASAQAAGLAADNLICALYFTTLYSLARGIPPDINVADPNADLREEQQKTITVGSRWWRSCTRTPTVMFVCCLPQTNWRPPHLCPVGCLRWCVIACRLADLLHVPCVGKTSGILCAAANADSRAPLAITEPPPFLCLPHVCASSLPVPPCQRVLKYSHPPARHKAGASCRCTTAQQPWQYPSSSATWLLHAPKCGDCGAASSPLPQHLR